MSETELWELSQYAAKLVQRSYGLSIEDTEDLQTNVFLKCRGKCENKNYRAQRLFVIRSAVRLQIDAFRTKASRKDLLESAAIAGSIKSLKGDSMTEVENADYTDWLLAKLPELERDAIILHAQGFTYIEAAKLLDVTHACFKSRFFRAQRKLRKLMTVEDIETFRSSC